MQGLGGIAIFIALLTLVWWYNEKRQGLMSPDAPTPTDSSNVGQ